MDTSGEGSPPSNKRFKMGRNKQIKIKIKDVDVLVHCEKMPIKMGMCVFTGSSSSATGQVLGTIVQHRDKAAIEYNINGETRYGNISKFYRDVTGEALQEKGICLELARRKCLMKHMQVHLGAIFSSRTTTGKHTH